VANFGRSRFLTGFASHPKKANKKRNYMLHSSRMARRPDPVEFDHPLTPDQLHQLSRRLGMLSSHGVMEAYRRAHLACSMPSDQPPKAADIQEMVTAWKLMRAWAKRRPADRG
jgi:hypothetical protein